MHEYLQCLILYRVQHAYNHKLNLYFAAAVLNFVWYSQQPAIVFLNLTQVMVVVQVQCVFYEIRT